MTPLLLASLYLLALTFFLGLDIVSKVPATMYALVLAALGGLAAVSLVAAIHGAVSLATASGGVLGLAATALAGACLGGALVAVERLLAAFRRKQP